MSQAPPPNGFVFSSAAMNKPPDEGGGNHTKLSFRDKLIGQQQAPPPRKRVDLLDQNLTCIEYKDNNPLLPMVHIDEKVFDGLCEPWKDALVVKLLGKNIGFLTMKERLQKIWKLQHAFEIMDIVMDITW